MQKTNYPLNATGAATVPRQEITKAQVMSVLKQGGMNRAQRRDWFRKNKKKGSGA